MADRAGPSGGGTAVEEVLVAERPRLVGLAYRITGSRLDAEDIVQDAWERARRAGDVDRPAAWLTTVVARLAFDHLRSAHRRRESYVGPWLPEPIVTGRPEGTVAAGTGRPGAAAGAATGAAPDPGELAELADSLTFGFLRVLEALSPVERVVFVLADVFGTPFSEIAEVVGRSPDACRQVASRARARVRDAGRRGRAPADAARVADDLVAALAAGDADRVVALLAPDVVVVSDGGAATKAARRPVVGRDRVLRLLLHLMRRGLEEDLRFERVELNRDPGVLLLAGDSVAYAAAIEARGEAVGAVHIVANPEKLAALRLAGGVA